MKSGALPYKSGFQPRRCFPTAYHMEQDTLLPCSIPQNLLFNSLTADMIDHVGLFFDRKDYTAVICTSTRGKLFAIYATKFVPPKSLTVYGLDSPLTTQYPNLTDLDLSNCGALSVGLDEGQYFSDFRPISKLSKLQKLKLPKKASQDLKFLDDLPNLEKLSVRCPKSPPALADQLYCWFSMYPKLKTVEIIFSDKTVGCYDREGWNEETCSFTPREGKSS